MKIIEIRNIIRFEAPEKRTPNSTLCSVHIIHTLLDPVGFFLLSGFSISHSFHDHLIFYLLTDTAIYHTSDDRLCL